MKRAPWLALAVSLVLAPRSAAARDVAIEVHGCVELDAAALGEAVTLETAGAWVVVAGAQNVVRIDLPGCDAAEWSLRVLDATGESRLGPVQITMRGLREDARTRVASLWIAEWLATLSEELPRAAVGLSDPYLEPQTIPAARTPPVDGPPADQPAAAPAGLPAELRVRGAVLAAFRYGHDLWGYLGGADLGLSVAYVDDFGFGLEITLGALYGSQWNLHDLGVGLGTISAFALATLAPWMEISAGVRSTVEGVFAYSRPELLGQPETSPHGLIGGFLRGQIRLTRGVTAAADVELAGALGGIRQGWVDTSLPEDREPRDGRRATDVTEVQLLDGLHFTARLGLVFELLPAPTPATGLLDL